MILNVLRMRRNDNRNVFNDRKNVSATPLPGDVVPLDQSGDDFSCQSPI